MVNQHVLAIHCFRLAPLAENTIHQESPAVGWLPYVANTHPARVPVVRSWVTIWCGSMITFYYFIFCKTNFTN
ncbi:MAG: hypothetical protein LBQ66_09225 [Planctomycetaceae bacterium]|nr:hypothetical protein [Planctomycetaceae bacterium]